MDVLLSIWTSALGGFGEAGFDCVIQIQDIMRLARLKVRGGEEKKSKMSAAEALARLGMRVCIDIAPQSQMSQELVSQYMRLMSYVSADREAMITAHCSEQVLVQAAAQMTGIHFSVIFAVPLEIVDAGYRGKFCSQEIAKNLAAHYVLG